MKCSAEQSSVETECSTVQDIYQGVDSVQCSVVELNRIEQGVGLCG
jgi:hypothetical protein